MTGDWRYWPWFILRGTGFPYEILERQRSAPLLAALDEQLDAEAALVQVCAETLARLDHRTSLGEALGSDGTRVVFKAIRGGKPAVAPGATQPTEVRALLDETLARWNHAVAALEGAQKEAERRFSETLAQARRALHETVSTDAFQEAVFLSSREAAQRMSQLLEAPPDAPRNSRQRARESLAVSYLQRFCSKNDTISFFGPYVWGSIDEQAERALAYRAGDRLVDKREVFFEHWGVEGLAGVIRQDPEVVPHLRVELAPYLRLVASGIEAPGKPVQEIPDEYRALLERADGTRTVDVIGTELVAAGGWESLEEVRGAIADLLEQAILRDSMRVPTATHHPEDQLRALVADLPASCASRSRWLSLLDDLIAKRDRFRDAPYRDRPTLTREIDAVFESTAALKTERKAGQTLVGRTVFYEDCRRDVRQFVLGPGVVDAMRPLDFIYDSGRWMITESVRRQRPRWLTLHAELGGSDVPFLVFAEKADLLSFLYDRPVEREVVQECRRLWSEVIGPSPGVRRIELTSSELAARFGERLRCVEPPPYHYAELCAPDIQIAAASVEDIDAGRFLVVLGENHVAWNSLCMPALTPFCPDLPSLYRRFVGDAKQLAHVTYNNENYHRAAVCPPEVPELFEVETSRTPARVPRDRRLRAADLVVQRAGERLVVRARDGHWQAPLEEVVGLNLSQRLIRELPGGLLDGAYVPRVTVDRVVLEREHWTFAPSEVTTDAGKAPDEKTFGAAFFALQRFRREHGLPEQVFVRIPEERKPFLLDFGAPLLVENFLRLLEKASRVELTEMLPAPGELWLTDGSGRYTSEFRMAVW